MSSTAAWHSTGVTGVATLMVHDAACGQCLVNLGAQQAALWHAHVECGGQFGSGITIMHWCKVRWAKLQGGRDQPGGNTPPSSWWRTSGVVSAPPAAYCPLPCPPPPPSGDSSAGMMPSPAVPVWQGPAAAAARQPRGDVWAPGRGRGAHVAGAPPICCTQRIIASCRSPSTALGAARGFIGPAASGLSVSQS